MGEIADMMLDGTLCQWCGGLVDHPDAEMADWPRLCPGCAKDARKSGYELRDDGFGGFQIIDEPDENTVSLESVPVPMVCKVLCPYCKKRTKAAGIWDHLRNVHGIKGEKDGK